MRPLSWEEIIDYASSNDCIHLKTALDAGRIHLITALEGRNISAAKGQVQDALINACAKGLLSPQDLPALRWAIDYRNSVNYDHGVEPDKESTLRAVTTMKTVCSKLTQTAAPTAGATGPSQGNDISPKVGSGSNVAKETANTTKSRASTSQDNATIPISVDIDGTQLVGAAVELFKAIGKRLPEYSEKMRKYDIETAEKLRRRLALRRYARGKGVDLGDVQKAIEASTGRPVSQDDIDTAIIDAVASHPPKEAQVGWLDRLLGIRRSDK